MEILWCSTAIDKKIPIRKCIFFFAWKIVNDLTLMLYLPMKYIIYHVEKYLKYYVMSFVNLFNLTNWKCNFMNSFIITRK